MQFTRFSDPSAFSDLVLDLLLEWEAENNLVLGILSSVASTPRSHTDALLGIAHHGDPSDSNMIDAVIVRTPPFPVVVGFTSRAGMAQVAECVTEYLVDVYGSAIGGFNADTRIVSSYVSAWERLAGARMRPHMQTMIYKCTDPVAPPSIAGHPRRFGPEDVGIVREFVAGFYRDAIPDELDDDRIERYVVRMLEADLDREGIMLWHVGGSVVSMAAYSGPTPHGIRINAVYTPPARRGRGYASACVAELTARLLNQGRQFCFLFTDQANPTSNKIYRRIGYQPVSENSVWRTDH